MTHDRQGASWRRLLVESVAVTLSILLAFSVDAWWDASQERDRESLLLGGLLADYQATRSDLVLRAATAERHHRNSVLFRDLTAESAGRGSVQVPDSVLLSAVGGPTYEPATNTLDAALASGEIELIRSREIRAEISRWRVILADVSESEREVRRVSGDWIEPILAREVALGPYFDRAVDWDWGPGQVVSGHAEVTPTLELSGALAQRSFYLSFAAEGLVDLLHTLDRLVSLITAELDS